MNSVLDHTHVLNKYIIDCGRLSVLIAPIFHVSLYPCPMTVPSHTDFGSGHVTCFGRRDSNKLDGRRGLKKHLCGSDFFHRLCDYQENRS